MKSVTDLGKVLEKILYSSFTEMSVLSSMHTYTIFSYLAYNSEAAHLKQHF